MRLAHCSDLHLLSLDGTRMLDFASKRWIGGMNLLTNRGRHYHAEAFEDMVEDLNDQRVDHVLCTGDVTNLAFEQEFRFARERFDRLDLGPDGVTVVPGNHDAYVQEGTVHFARVFADYARSDAGWTWRDRDPGSRDGTPETESQEPERAGEPAGNGARVAGSHDGTGEAHGDDRSGETEGGNGVVDGDLWPLVRVRGEMAIVGLSTSLQTPWFTAWGRIGEQQLARAEAALTDRRLADKLRVVAIHHPPAGTRAASRIRGLKDRAALADLLSRTGAELVVHGHEHRDLHETLPGPSGDIDVLGVPSGTYEANHPERTARYRIFEIEDGRVASHRMRVWQRAERRFVPDRQPT